MRVIGILQPGYLPWLGFFEQMLRCHYFVIYDDVQYDKHGWRNRNRIKGPKDPVWLTVPVRLKGNQRLINQVEINPTQPRWAKKHLGTLRQHYNKAPYFKEYFPQLEEVLMRPWRLLVELDLELIRLIAGWFGLKSKLILSSELGCYHPNPSGRLIEIIRKLKGDVFYEGASGRNYLDLDQFTMAGLQVVFQDYQPMPYPQQYDGFTPFLSAIDLIFNCGSQSVRYLSGLNPPALPAICAEG